MIKHLQCLVLGFVALLVPVFAEAQTEAGQAAMSFSRIGKHEIGLSAGLLSKVNSTNKVVFGNIMAENKSAGFMGSLSYAYWLEENLAVGVSGGLLSADANSSVTGAAIRTETATVVPILFGVKYQPFTMTWNNKLRPIVSVAIGPYIGTASNAQAGLTLAAQSYSETAVGGRVAAGLDLALTNWLTFEAGAAYHIVSNFENRIGSERNYSGPEFSIGINLLF